MSVQYAVSSWSAAVLRRRFLSASSTISPRTRIRLQLAIYFCLHRGSLPEKHRSTSTPNWAKPALTNSVKNYMSHQSNTRTKRERVEYLNPQRGTDRPLCGDGRLHHRRGK